MNSAFGVGPPIEHGTTARMLTVTACFLLLAAGAQILPEHHRSGGREPRHSPSPETVLDLSLEKDGSCAVGGEPTPRQDVAAILTRWCARHRDGGVRLRVPRDLSLPVLLEWMRTLDLAGVRHSTVEIRQP